MVEIPFPLKRERYLDLGQEAMNSGKIQQASDYFKEAYACQKDFPLNFLLVSTLLELKKCDEALAVAEEFLPDYEKHLDFLGLYLQCLLETENFRRAHQIVNQKLLSTSGIQQKKIMAYKQVVRQKELMHQQLTQEAQAKLKEKLAQLPSERPVQQLAAVKDCIALNQDDFLEVSKRLLIDPKVHYLAKALLLEEVASLQGAGTVKILYRNQNMRQVSLYKIRSIPESPLFERLQTILEVKLRHKDPILQMNLLEEMRLSYALLYPFNQEYITDPQAWVDALIYQYNPEYVSCQNNLQNILQLVAVQEELKHDLNQFQPI